MIKAKLRRIGNSLGVILPKNVITSYKEGEEIGLNVITLDKVARDKGWRFNTDKGVYEKD